MHIRKNPHQFNVVSGNENQRPEEIIEHRLALAERIFLCLLTSALHYQSEFYHADVCLTFRTIVVFLAFLQWKLNPDNSSHRYRYSHILQFTTFASREFNIVTGKRLK